MQLFIFENKDIVRYFKPENPFGTQLKYSLPNIVEYINENKDHLDPWFRAEAEKRHYLINTVLDRRSGLGTLAGSSGTQYVHWSADIDNSADYYRGGIMMPNRNAKYP